MVPFDVENAHSDGPSKADILQLLDARGPEHAAESAYLWLEARISLHQQVRAKGEMGVIGAIPAVTLWDMLSTLVEIGETIGFRIDTSIQNNKIVFIIHHTLEGPCVPLFVEELLVTIFARLARKESRIAYVII